MVKVVYTRLCIRYRHLCHANLSLFSAKQSLHRPWPELRELRTGRHQCTSIASERPYLNSSFSQSSLEERSSPKTSWEQFESKFLEVRQDKDGGVYLSQLPSIFDLGPIGVPDLNHKRLVNSQRLGRTTINCFCAERPGSFRLPCGDSTNCSFSKLVPAVVL